MAPGIGMDKWRLGWALAGLALAGAFVYIVWSFVGTFVFGVFLYYATRPVHRRVKGRIGQPSVAAAVSLFLLAMPALTVITYAGAIGVAELDQFIQTTDLGQYEEQLQPYTDISGVVAEPESLLTGGNVSAVGDVLGASLKYVGLVGTALLHLFVMIAIAFYLLRDDRKLSRWFHSRFDDDRGVVAAYLRAVDRDFNNVFFGNILNAFLTGTIGAIAYSVLNLYAPTGLAIPYAALVGLLAGAASLIPVIGMKLVYFPVTLYLLGIAVVEGRTEALWFPAAFFATSLVVVDTIPDLGLRPYVSGRSLHVGMVMMAYIFGPLLFGWYGIFLGPMLLVLIVHFVRIVLPELIAGEPIQPYAVDPTYMTQPVPDPSPAGAEGGTPTGADGGSVALPEEGGEGTADGDPSAPPSSGENAAAGSESPDDPPSSSDS